MGGCVYQPRRCHDNHTVKPNDGDEARHHVDRTQNDQLLGDYYEQSADDRRYPCVDYYVQSLDDRLYLCVDYDPQSLDDDYSLYVDYCDKSPGHDAPLSHIHGHVFDDYDDNVAAGRRLRTVVDGSTRLVQLPAALVSAASDRDSAAHDDSG